jgi:hypothetical protein
MGMADIDDFHGTSTGALEKTSEARVTMIC